MKKLTNKKGFTLIEMLVVIAIIAILVAIIIPVVSSATEKAAAATDAANMRSFKAEIVTKYLSNDGVTVTKSGSTYTVDYSAVATPAMKAVSSMNVIDGAAGSTANWSVQYNGSAFTVTYCEKDINDFATVAGQKAETTASPNPSTQP